jgi:hypothetical protein
MPGVESARPAAAWHYTKYQRSIPCLYVPVAPYTRGFFAGFS